MDRTWEMLLLGAGLIAAGAIICFLFWVPRFEEGDPHYAGLGAELGSRRKTVMITGFLIAALGLATIVWQLHRLVGQVVPWW
jgi:hypothetical protein